MTAQLDLLTVPPNRTRLQIWQERHGVEAYRTDITHSPDQQWMAGKAISQNRGEYEFGPDEESACLNLCRKLNIPGPYDTLNPTEAA